MKRAIGLAVIGLAFLAGVAAKTYYESWNVDKAKCQKIVIFIGEDRLKADFYWDLLDASKTVLRENVRTVCDPAVQTNNVNYADIKAYVNGGMKDHYKAMKQLYSGVDE